MYRIQMVPLGTEEVRVTEPLLDKLHERLVIERAAVELYALALSRARREQNERLAGRLAEFQEQSQEHADMLEKLIGELGGDLGEPTQSGTLALKETEGLVEVCRLPNASFRQILGAVLAVELIDSAGWELLADLARDVVLREGWQEWLEAAREEDRKHLGFVRRELERVERGALSPEL